MTKSTKMQFSFNGGELSPLLDARIDYPKYESGAKELKNFVPTVYGPITKRPGTAFIERHSQSAAFYPFEFNQAESYVLEFNEDGNIYFYFGDGIVTSGGSPYSIAHPFGSDVYNMDFAQNGDISYFANKTFGVYKLTRIDSAVFTFQPVSFLNGPFQDDNTDETLLYTIENLTATGEGEVGNFIKVFPPAGVSVGQYVRFFYEPASKFDTWVPLSSDFSGNAKEYEVDDVIQYEGRVYIVTGFDPELGAVTESQTGTRSPLHEKGTESDGNLLLEYYGDSWGYMEVTLQSGGGYSGFVIKSLPIGLVIPGIGMTNTTEDWASSSFSSQVSDPDFGYPSAVTFHEQRLVLAGSDSEPQTIWGSVIGDFENFDRGTEDNESYSFALASTRKNPIEWLASNVSLQIGTTGAEFNAFSSGPTITPTDITIQQITTYGSQEGAPVVITNGFTLFVQSGGNKIRELRFSDETQRNFARDLNKVAEHISYDGIKFMVYQGEPYQILWVIIGSSLYGLTYETDEDVFAWHRHDVTGNVISASVIPAGAQDRLWLLIEREGQYNIEFMTPFFTRNQSQAEAIFVDSSLTYDGPPTTVIPGLDHLEGKEVYILSDGAIETPQVVTNGQVEIAEEGELIHVGLPYQCAYQSMRLSGGSQEGIAQGKTKKLKNVIFRLDATGAGLEYGLGYFRNNETGFDYSVYDPGFIDTRATDDLMDNAPPLQFGDTNLSGFPGGGSTEFYVRIQHNEPTPCTVITFISQLNTGER